MNRRPPTASTSDGNDQQSTHSIAGDLRQRQHQQPQHHQPEQQANGATSSTGINAALDVGQIASAATLAPSGATAGTSAAAAGSTATSNIYDPWAMYGGNIAAACQATNDFVQEQSIQQGAGGGGGEDGGQVENAVDDEKQKQRASSRLIAWHSRERKRIEFEVLQERKDELTGRNASLKQENERLKLVINYLKSGGTPHNTLGHLHAARAGSTTTATAPTSVNDGGMSSSMLASLMSSNIAQQQQAAVAYAAAAAAAASAANSSATNLPSPSIQRRLSTVDAAAALNASSLVSANLSRLQQQHAASQQDSHPLLSSLHQRIAAGLFPIGIGGGALAPEATSNNNPGTSVHHHTSTIRGGLADPPPRPPTLLLSQAITQNTRLPIQRFLGGNDIIAPTIFAPLQRGASATSGLQQHHEAQQHLATLQGQYQQQHQQEEQQQSQGMIPSGFVSPGDSHGLPLTLSSLLAPAPSTNTGVDVPLFRAVQNNKRKGPDSPEDGKTSPSNKKMKHPPIGAAAAAPTSPSTASEGS